MGQRESRYAPDKRSQSDRQTDGRLDGPINITLGRQQGGALIIRPKTILVYQNTPVKLDSWSMINTMKNLKRE